MKPKHRLIINQDAGDDCGGVVNPTLKFQFGSLLLIWDTNTSQWLRIDRHTLASLVDVAGTPGPGQLLEYNGTTWGPVSLPSLPPFGIAEEIMPGAVVAQIAKLGEVGLLHQPMSGIEGETETACQECFGGIFAVDPELSRACGCWGLLQPICATCAGRHENGHWYRPKWPCETWKAMIHLAD